VQVQIQNFSVEPNVEVLYNYYINRRQRQMSDTDFFSLNQEQWFTEFVEAEVSEILQDTNAHDNFFEFDDVPF
jgi:hypothetical protein